MKDILLLTGLAILAFCGSALDSQGLAGWIAIAGVLAAFGLIGAGARKEMRVEEMAYSVLRHGGRSCDYWREVYQGEDENKARKIFMREYKKMRQGGVQLIGPDGPLNQQWSPRLRTRW